MSRMSRPVYDRAKRAADVLVSGVLLAVTAPVQVGVAAMVRHRLGSPVLFRQQRPGRDGVPFELVKFRTMREPGPDGFQNTDADRLTPLGIVLRSTSLDELPTLWNVFRGDMSMVGPRPLLMSYLDRYTPHEARRHEVRPGVTGLAQVRGRNALSWDERFTADIEYVEKRSFGLDLKILALTVLAVLRRAGVSAPGEATMPEFLGSARGR